MIIRVIGCIAKLDDHYKALKDRKYELHELTMNYDRHLKKTLRKNFGMDKYIIHFLVPPQLFFFLVSDDKELHHKHSWHYVMVKKSG